MMKKLITAIAMAGAAGAFAMQGSVSTETETFSGDVKWHARDKKYVIEKGKITKEFALADVTGLDIPKPPTFDKAVSQVEAGQGSSAIPALAKIVADYKMLQWDKPAGRYLVEAYLAANNAQKAYEVAESIIKEDKSAEWRGDLAPAYWQALLKLGKNQKLEALVKKAAISGDRAASASALVMRGDIILATEGDSQDSYKKALTDAYLRVMLMYADEPCREARLQAMQKAAGCFDKLGQASRAEQIRSQARKI